MSSDKPTFNNGTNYTPPPPPKPEDPEVKKQQDKARDVESRVRGKAATNLTQGRDLGDAGYFRTLLGT